MPAIVALLLCSEMLWWHFLS